MDTSNDFVTQSGLLPLTLDGRRPTAPGMPPSMTGQYIEAQRWYTSQKIPDTLEAWEHQYKHATSIAHILPCAPEYCWEQMIRLQLRRNEHEAKCKAVEKLQSELGPREFTLTYSPSWYEDDAAAQLAMRVAIDKLTRYYKDEIIEFHAVGEFTGAGRAHVHAWYHLTGGRKITDKNFKRAWKHWNPRKKIGKGFEGGHHESVKRLSDFSSYAEKHLDDAWMNVNITNAYDNSSA